VDWYSQTLESYERMFGEAPPADIWPTPQQRFATAGQGRWIDSSRHWVLSKRRVLTTASWLFLLIALPLANGCAGQEAIGPFALGGSGFLVFYGCLLLVTAGLACVIHWRAQPAIEAEGEDVTDPYEIACLAGGPRAAVTAALAALLTGGHVELHRKWKAGFLGLFRSDWILQQGEALPKDAHHLEKTLHSALKDTQRTLLDVFKIGCAQVEPLSTKLTKRGLVFDPENMPVSRNRIPGLIMLATVLLGAVRVIQGLSNHEEVGFLVTMMALAAVVGVSVAFRPAFRTTAGRESSSSSRRGMRR
jgi:uncharacterized protein (TIGR04222 family)